MSKTKKPDSSEPISQLEDERIIDPAIASIPKLYANGYVAGFTLSDMYVVGQLNTSPVFVLNMSYTTAKSLAALLENMVTDFEKRADFEIHTMSDVGGKLNKSYKK